MTLNTAKKMNEQKTRFSNNLAKLLINHQLSCGQLANKLNIPVMTIRRLLSGETSDPRISTLTLLANYFKISLDALINEDINTNDSFLKNAKSYLVPKLQWDTLSTFIDNHHQHDWQEWQPVSLNNHEKLSVRSFALESRPSMYPRYLKGTLFIIDPEAKPADGDIILIEMPEKHEFTLRELIIDPPDWRLAPLVPNSNTINFNNKKHIIRGVCMLTILYNPKLHG